MAGAKASVRARHGEGAGAGWRSWRWCRILFAEVSVAGPVGLFLSVLFGQFLVIFRTCFRSPILIGLYQSF